MDNERISFRIEKHLGVLSTSTKGWRREVNMVSWNGRAPKLDIRDWDENHQKMGRGITLTNEELAILVSVASANGQECFSAAC